MDITFAATKNDRCDDLLAKYSDTVFKWPQCKVTLSKQLQMRQAETMIY